MAYNVFKFNPPEGGWPELKYSDTPQEEEPRECNFQPVPCDFDGSCSHCPRFKKELQ